MAEENLSHMAKVVILLTDASKELEAAMSEREVDAKDADVKQLYKGITAALGQALKAALGPEEFEIEQAEMKLLLAEEARAKAQEEEEETADQRRERRRRGLKRWREQLHAEEAEREAEELKRNSQLSQLRLIGASSQSTFDGSLGPNRSTSKFAQRRVLSAIRRVPHVLREGQTRHD